MTSRPPPTPFFTCTHAYFWRRLMWDGGQSWSFVPDNLYLICHGSALGCTMLYILLSEKKWMCFVSHTMYIDWQSKQLKDCSRSWITLHSHWLLLACVIHLGLCLEFSIVQVSGWDVAVDIRKVFQSESNIFYCWNCIAYARYLQCIQTKKYMQQASYFFMLWILVFSIWDFTELDMGVWE